MLTSTLLIIQFFFSIIIGLYFLNLLKSQQANKGAIGKESRKELEKLRRLKEIKLSEPLSEKTRPVKLSEIIGQDQGVRALKAAMCGPNPQHVIIYGPPGIGKTAAARAVLEEAKQMNVSPFKKEAHFVEIDATTLRFDERGIADPLIGSVHDPIYQGAGAYGVAGIPQPKMGAVTRAHGGVLFIDEIGELHPNQMNKLLKVLEDRKVFLESAYYSSEDNSIPSHIHEIFQKGLPADFRLIGATTRTPEDIPPALRSRCVEIFFRSLFQNEVNIITRNAAAKGGFKMEEGVAEVIARYASNGRDAVNIVQISGGIAIMEGRNTISCSDAEWVVEFGHYSPRIDRMVSGLEQVGMTNGLAVYGNNNGIVIEVEVFAAFKTGGSKKINVAGANNTASLSEKAVFENGELKITGIIEQEEIQGRNQRFRRTSAARSSIENVLTVLRKYMGIDCRRYDLHVNFPGGIPLDGPSAGLAIAAAIFSAISGLPVRGDIAMTGEVSICGKIKPVGGVPAKVEAARLAGIKKVIVPEQNFSSNINVNINSDIDCNSFEVLPVNDFLQAMTIIFGSAAKQVEMLLPSGTPSLPGLSL